MNDKEKTKAWRRFIKGMDLGTNKSYSIGNTDKMWIAEPSHVMVMIANNLQTKFEELLGKVGSESHKGFSFGYTEGSKVRVNTEFMYQVIKLFRSLGIDEMVMWTKTNTPITFTPTNHSSVNGSGYSEHNLKITIAPKHDNDEDVDVFRDIIINSVVDKL
jgi:hypothetical protein